jgi:hypothetical protein
MMKHFNYYVEGSGWADVWFVSDTQKVRFDVSYLSDPLTELCASLLDLINGNAQRAEICFLDEPGSHKLILERLDGGCLKTLILRSDYWQQNDADSSQDVPADIVYCEDDTIQNFSIVVCEGIQSLMERQTLEEYKKKWVIYEFPKNLFEELKSKCGFKK